MVRIVCIGSLVLAAVTAVSGHVIRRKHSPAGWQTAILEPYEAYHERYLNWDCEKQHNTAFFNNCCHPLLKDECIDVLEDRGCPSSPGAPTSSQPAHNNPPHVESTSTQPAYNNALPVEPAYTTPTPTPTPTTTHTEPPATPTTTSSPAQSTPTGLITGGQATYFQQKGNAGACGKVHLDSDFIAAIDGARYGDSHVVSPLCGRQVLIYHAYDPSKQVTVTIQDDCPTCSGPNSIDLSMGAFTQLEPLSVGEFPIKWMFLP